MTVYCNFHTFLEQKCTKRILNRTSQYAMSNDCEKWSFHLFFLDCIFQLKTLHFFRNLNSILVNDSVLKSQGCIKPIYFIMWYHKPTFAIILSCSAAHRGTWCLISVYLCSSAPSWWFSSVTQVRSHFSHLQMWLTILKYLFHLLLI